MKRLLAVLVLCLLPSLAGGAISVRVEGGFSGFSIRGYAEESLFRYAGFDLTSGVAFENTSFRPYVAFRYMEKTWSITIGLEPADQMAFLSVVVVW